MAVMNMNEEQNYINFDEYIKASEPHKRERAEAWRVAIGLQAVDENNELKNRYMLVNPPEEWEQPTTTEQAPHKHPTSTPQVQDKLNTENPNIQKLILVVGEKELSVKEIMEGLGFKDRKNVLNLYLNPATHEGYIRQLYPQSPRHPRQKYLLTVKGLALLNELKTK